jgi:hypothetical protein
VSRRYEGNLDEKIKVAGFVVRGCWSITTRNLLAVNGAGDGDVLDDQNKQKQTITCPIGNPRISFGRGSLNLYLVR